MTIRMSFAALLALGAAAFAAAGVDARPRPADTGANHSLDSVNQPVIQHSAFVLDLAAGPDGIAPGERNRLDAWFHSLGLGYGDRISIDGGYAPEHARYDIARVAAEYGLLLTDAAPVTAGAVQPGSVRVIVSRSFAFVPGCPQWRNSEGPSATSANYGCAINSNLAAMIADANDLVLGQAGSAVGDAAASAKAIKAYRDAPPTGTKGLTQSSTTQGSH
jgi:pilus assembly protein CpaD